MENNKKSFLGKMFSGKNEGDVKPADKKCIPCGAMNPPDAKFCFSCGSSFPVRYDSFDAFISYRRETASDLASLLKVQLENNFHKRIFIDIKELQVGRFDEALLRRIEETPNFILILSKSSLDRCQEKSDWLKREIVHALKTRRNIIPVIMKDFSFPTEQTWALLPPEMRVLSSLNGINYDHIHQDSDIRMVASYMKTEKEVPPVKLAPDTEEPPQPPPPPPGGRETKPGPIQTGSATPGQTSTGPVSTGQTPTGQIPAGQTPTGQTPTGQIKPSQGPPSRTSVPTDQSNAPYFPVTGVLVKDSKGSETILTEFGVRGDAGGPGLENALRDDLTITIGQGTKTIPWGQIMSIEMQSRDDATFKLCDGTSFDHVKLAPTRLVGKTQDDFSFSFELNSHLTITTLRDTTLPGRDELIRNIPILAKRAIPQANRWTLTIRPEGKGVLVTADNYYYTELKYAHTFMLPGPHKFMAHGKFVKFTVSTKVGENFTMELFPVETALALASALTRLNSLLSENNSPDGKKKKPEKVNPESLVFLKRGEFLTVGTRDSKTRSAYYGPGTVLQYTEKGKGEGYPWYRFRGVDEKDFWLEVPGPVDTTDRRVFFKITETGQVGYMAEILGERTDPWGSIEEFKIDDDTVGPTVVRFDQIVSMTSKNGEMTVQKDSGILSGTLPKLGNFNAGSWTKGPCLVTSDAVIPLVRTNRVISLTVTRIDENEKPLPVPVPVYSDKTQIKFISQTNSGIGHFDMITPDNYIQLDDMMMGWLRISIAQIVRISVDPSSKEAPVIVETTAGRTYKGICNDPFNLSGSVFSFGNARKSLTLVSAIHDYPNAEAPERPGLEGDPAAQGESAGATPSRELSWSMRTTEGPGQRKGFGMTFDEKQELIILHGGYGPGNESNRTFGIPVITSMSAEQNDTWSWNGSSWKLLGNDSPKLASHALAFCKKTRQNIISGGWTGSIRVNDTHILTGDKWIKTEPGIEYYKGGFQNHAMVYDDKRKTIVLFGGLTNSFPGGQVALGDTWEWDGKSWTRLNVTGPEPRWGHKMVYEKSTGTILLFGGYDGKKYYDDTWIWNGNMATWEKVAPVTIPIARCHHGLACDTARDCVLMFGGLSASDTPLNDLWEWNGANWTLLTAQTPPKPRYDHGFVYDPVRSKSFLYGGFDGKGFFGDSWELTV